MSAAGGAESRKRAESDEGAGHLEGCGHGVLLVRAPLFHGTFHPSIDRPAVAHDASNPGVSPLVPTERVRCPQEADACPWCARTGKVQEGSTGVGTRTAHLGRGSLLGRADAL